MYKRTLTRILITCSVSCTTRTRPWTYYTIPLNPQSLVFGQAALPPSIPEMKQRCKLVAFHDFSNNQYSRDSLQTKTSAQNMLQWISTTHSPIRMKRNLWGVHSFTIPPLNNMMSHPWRANPPGWMKVSRSPWVRSLLPAGQSLVESCQANRAPFSLYSSNLWMFAWTSISFVVWIYNHIPFFATRRSLEVTPFNQNLQSIFFARFTFIRWRAPPSPKPSS